MGLEGIANTLPTRKTQKTEVTEPAKREGVRVVLGSPRTRGLIRQCYDRKVMGMVGLEGLVAMVELKGGNSATECPQYHDSETCMHQNY